MNHSLLQMTLKLFLLTLLQNAISVEDITFLEWQIVSVPSTGQTYLSGDQ
jgi:hypothetical protein